MGNFRMTRPANLTVGDILPPVALARHLEDFDSGPGPDEDLPTSLDMAVASGAKDIPSKPYDQLLWRAYVHGAGWGDTEEHADYPDWDDASYYVGTTHGQAMLVDFYQLLSELKPEPVSNTMCPLGRPYRAHAKRCSPECDWSAS